MAAVSNCTSTSLLDFPLLRVITRTFNKGSLAAARILLALVICVAWNQTYAQPPLQRLHDHVRGAVTNRQAALVDTLPPDQTLQLTIVMPLRNQSELTSLLERLYDPSSLDYRHFLTVDQFTEQFGPTPQDYQTVVDFAQASGFTVTDTPRNRLIVPIQATVEQIESALHLRMGVYQHPTEERTFYSPDQEPLLNLSVPIAHIAGLNNYSLPHPMHSRAQAVEALASVTGSGPGGSYLGSDMRAAYYGGTTLTGIGQVVGLLEFGGYNLSNVNATFTNAGQSYGVPINNVLLDGATGAPYGDDAEQVLDIVQAIGMAPGLSQVRVYIGPGTVDDDANIFNAMATENLAKQISVSWGWIPEDHTVDDVFFLEFAAQGQSVFVASGDAGAFDASISPYFYPAEDAYVTSVGGTHLTTSGPHGSWTSETAWNFQQYGSGGGVSPDGFGIPSWQTGVATSSNGGSTTLRNEPDVAMEADSDNYNCSVHYGCSQYLAGTSFAAPRWAGFMALINQQAVEAGTAPSGGVGFLNPSIYSIGKGSHYKKDLHDITSGNNRTENQPIWFSATTGYDLVTGWGSPTGQSLIDELAGPQALGFWIAPSSGTLTLNQGGTNSTTVSVTGAGGFTGSVDLAITSTLPTGVTATWGTNPTSSTSTLTLTASSSAPSSSSNVTITGTSGSLTATTSLAVAVHAPSFTLSATPNTVAVNQNSSGTSSITVTPQYGFTGSVNLAVTSGLPAGVTASWGTNPTSGSSVLTLTASGSATPGTATLTITGTSGSLSATTTLSLAVHGPSFTLWATNQDIGQGSSGTAWVYVTPQYGFTGSVNLAVTSGLPSGVTASFSPNPTSGTSSLILTASSTAPVGQYTLTITGTSGSLSATTTLTLGVYAPSFTLWANGMDIGQGTSGTSNVMVYTQYGFSGSVNLSVSGLPSGVTAVWSQNPTNSSSTLTLVASSTAPLGQYTLTITGTSGSLSATTNINLGVHTPSFTLNLAYFQGTIGQGSSGTASFYLQSQYGFSGNANMSVSGLPSGVIASFSPNPTTYSTTMTLNVSASASVGSYTLTITAVSGSISASTTMTLQIKKPTFTLNANNVDIGRGTSATAYVYVSPQYGFTGNVKLAVASGLPSGVTASFDPNPTTGSSTLTLTASSTAPIGQYTLTISGTYGSASTSTTLTLGVHAPSFTLTDYSSVTLGQGTSSSSSVNVNPLYGFTGSVNLAVTSGLPSGVTASFSPNPTNSWSTLTLTASNSAPVGQYTLTITGTSGSLTATTTVTLGVYVPSFTLSDYGSVTLGQGSSSTSYVYLNPLYGFSGNVNLAVTAGLPSGVTASFSPNPTVGNSVLTLTASSTAALGQYTLTITGTSGSLSATTTLSLGIYAPSFTLSDYNSTMIGQGSSGTSWVNVNPQNGFSGSVNLAVTSGLPSGVTASFSPNPATGSSTLTLTASSTAALGQYTLTITGTSGSLSATTTLSLSIYAPSFTLGTGNSASVGQGASATSYVYVYPQNGFTGNVNLAVTAGLPSGVTASFSPNPATGTSVLTLTASSTAPLGQYTLTITGTSGSLSATTPLSLGIYAPTFKLSDYDSPTVGQGASTTSSVWISPQNGFTGSVNLAVTSGLPSGVTASFSPNPATGNSTLTLTASSTAPLGQYTLIITGTSGSLTATTTLSLSIYTPGFQLSAYNVSLGLGTSGTSTVWVTPQSGFTGSVNLAVTSGLPSGVTASFSPNPTTGASTLTLTASSTASLGQYMLTITGTSGSLSSTTTMSLSIYAPTFTLGSNGGLTVGQGSSATSSVYVSPQNGFTGNVNLAITSGLPNGVTASFSPNPTTGLSTLTLTASSTASLGQYTLTITGTSGSVSATTTLSLGVYAPSFTLSSNNTVVEQGTSSTSSVYLSPQYGFSGSVNFAVSGLPSGVTASFSPNPATGNVVLTLTASSTASLGQYMATITGTSGSLSVTTPLIVTVQVLTPVSTTTTLSIDASGGTLAIGAHYTLTAVVSPTTGYLAPTGNVLFTVGSSTQAAALNSSGFATYSGTAPATAGTLTMSAAYQETPPFLASTSNTLSITVAVPAKSTPVVTVTLSTSPITANQSLTVNITVAGTSGSSTPTGSVTLASGSYSSGSTALSGGGASINIPAGSLATGVDTLTASYSPDAASSSLYSGATGSNSVTVTGATKITPTISWATPGPITYGVGLSGLQLNASSTVDGSFSYSPATGAVLGAGTQTLSTTFTPTDSTNYTTATASVTLTVGKTSPILTITPSASPITTAQPLTVTIAASGAGGGSSPSGSITLSSGSYSSASTTLNNGTASISIPAGSLAVGDDILNVSYGGDSNFNSSSASASVTVTTVASPSFTVTGTAVTVLAGATSGNASTITVTPTGGFTGSVTLTATVTSSPAGVQYPPTLSFGSTSPISIAGTASGTATLSIATTAATSAALATPKARGIPWVAAGGATLACLIFLGIPARRRSWRAMLGMLLLLAALATGAVSCGGGGGGGGNTGHAGTTAGTYIVTVTATSGSVSAQSPINLRVE